MAKLVVNLWVIFATVSNDDGMKEGRETACNEVGDNVITAGLLKKGPAGD